MQNIYFLKKSTNVWKEIKDFSQGSRKMQMKAVCNKQCETLASQFLKWQASTEHV